MSERDIFTAAREMTDPAARCAYLDGACGGDPGLRSRVEALLRAHDQPDSLLDHPAVAPHDPDSGTTRTIGPEDGAATDDEALTFLAPPTRPDSLGRIGHYEVLQVLGRGGFGIVFRAFDEMLQRVVALKVMAPQLAATSPARKRFLREARSSAQVRHENVVQVYEVAEQPLPYLAMEFIPGETLQQRLDRVGPLDVPEVLRIGRQIAEGLAAAHATDLIHRDIKPGNVLLEGGQHKVKITDFGLARAADDASISQSGIIAGTPMYMAPEQAQGQTLDQRADLFSLGSVLYQMVTGRPPFRAGTTVAVLKRVAEDTPRPIREIIPETPQWLCDIIAKLHAKDPDERYQSAREVADVLADCEAQLKANARLKDYSRIPRGKPRRSGRRKWTAAAATVLLPVIALAVTEYAGVTHLFPGQQGTSDNSESGKDPQAKAPPAAIAPFDAAQARAHQEAWAKSLGVPVESTNTIGMRFKLIPAGTFTMGSSPKEIERALSLVGKDGWVKDAIQTEGPPHEVEITQPFYMGVTEVTVGQFRQFVEEAKYTVGDDRWKKPGFEQFDDYPVVFVSWDDAVAFCTWLSKKEGKKYRLPTEAEWEYCCRAGKDTRYCFGDDDVKLEDYCWWYDKNSGDGTKPVGKKKPNDWGLCDMHGNAWEWCQDSDDPNYYKTSPPKDPIGPGAGGQRMLRGGSWHDAPVHCRSAFRTPRDRGFRLDNIGFRVVLVVSPPAGVRTESGAKDNPSSPAIAPFTDADVQRIAALPAALQVEEVRKELIRRNPRFVGKVEHTIGDGVVTEFRIGTSNVTDIAPIRAFKALRMLEMSHGLLADLTPLEGMNLAALRMLDLRDTKVSDAGMVYFKDCKDLRYLILADTKVTDRGLAHFKGCKNLTYLHLDGTQLSDEGLANFKDCKALTHLLLAGTKVSGVGLANFKGCKNLTHLHLAHTQMGDAGLAHFKGMPLAVLWIENTGITDLTPLQGMPLEDIHLTPKNITRGLDVLRAMKSLKTIGIEWDQAWPAAEFWQRYDRGEFKE